MIDAVGLVAVITVVLAFVVLSEFDAALFDRGGFLRTALVTAVVILAGTLASHRLPLEGITLILGVDELMDMARTMTNAVGNCLATVVIAKWEGEFVEARDAALQRIGRENAERYLTDQPLDFAGMVAGKMWHMWHGSGAAGRSWCSRRSACRASSTTSSAGRRPRAAWSSSGCAWRTTP